MEAMAWSDYLCPWCYVGQARSRQMEALGLTVVHRPFELHPQISPEGRRIRADGSLAPTFARVAQEASSAGLAFRAPTRMPNTRRALETAEWVRVHHPDAFGALHASLFAAQFAYGQAIDDPAVIDRLVAEAGAPVDEARAAIERGEGSTLVDRSMADARAQGIASVPTWVLPGGFTVPGALDADTVERWVTKLMTRAAASSADTSEPAG